LAQIKKIPHEHTCQSTGKVEKNKMAINHWVKDRVINWEKRNMSSTIESVTCPVLSPVAVHEKGKAKKSKVIRSKKKL
jgi:hypothetical protein